VKRSTIELVVRSIVSKYIDLPQEEVELYFSFVAIPNFGKGEVKRKVIAEIENLFEIKFSEDDFKDIWTLEDLVYYIVKYLEDMGIMVKKEFV